MHDTWAYYLGSVEESKLLYDNPHEYLTNLFHNNYDHGAGGIFASHDSYWNDLKSNIFIKVLSIFNLFTFGNSNYYVNVVFYSFVTLSGPIAVYRVMADIFPGKRNIILLACFLIPSFLFWTSGLGKEGLIFTATAAIIYCFYFGIKEKKWTILRLFFLMLSLILLLTLRNFIFILLMAGIFVWIISLPVKKYSFLFFSAVYILFSVVFFTARYVSPRLDFPKAVVNKQEDFSKLEGEASIPIKALEPTAASFIRNTPQAISLSSFRPFPGDVRHLLSLAASLEINLLLLLILIYFFFRTRSNEQKKELHFFVFYSLSVLLAIGFSVNNLGAIVRYRSIILPILMVPLIAQIDWNRFTSHISSFFKFKGE